MMNKNQKQKGVSIYLALVIMVIFLAMSFGLADILLSLRKTVRGMEDSANALAAADAGAEIILSMDKKCKEPGCDTGICKAECTGLQSGKDANGTLINGAGYVAQITRNCGLNTIISTGSYKETKRKIEATRGRSSPGVYVNSATGKTCDEICSNLDCICQGIGYEEPPAGSPNGYYWSLTSPMPVDCIQKENGACGTLIENYSPILCPSTTAPVKKYLAEWTYCYCTSTTP